MIILENIAKAYRTSEIETWALADVSFSVQGGEFLAIMGPSGSGKSTLLGILGLLDRPTRGSYRLFGEEVSTLSEQSLTRLRRSSIGFIFQSFNLIDDLNVYENIDVGLIYRKVERKERKRRILEVLERVGVSHRARHYPSQLSGGQQQRVAIARAIVAEPKLILADEPTGNLDSLNGENVLKLLSDTAKAGTTVIMVTHSPSHASVADRTVSMLDGRVVTEVVAGV